MNTMTKKCLLAICIMYAFSVAYSEENDKWKLNLQFEDSQFTKELSKSELRSLGGPSYKAEIYFKTPSHFDMGKGSPLYVATVTSPLSERKNIAGRVRSGNLGSFRRDPNGFTVFSLYGNNKEEIKSTAQILINVLNDIAYENIKKVRSELEDYQNKEAELEKEISRLTNDKDRIISEIESVRNDTPYRSEEIIREIEKILQLTDIEIIGIQAKLDMIKQQNEKLHKLDNNSSRGASERIFQMRLEQEVELAGAMARKNAAQLALKKASDYRSLVTKKNQIENALNIKQGQRPGIQHQISRLEKIIENPGIEMKPVELVDNKIIIYAISSIEDIK